MTDCRASAFGGDDNIIGRANDYGAVSAIFMVVGGYLACDGDCQINHGCGRKYAFGLGTW